MTDVVVVGLAAAFVAVALHITWWLIIKPIKPMNEAGEVINAI